VHQGQALVALDATKSLHVNDSELVRRPINWKIPYCFNTANHCL